MTAADVLAPTALTVAVASLLALVALAALGRRTRARDRDALAAVLEDLAAVRAELDALRAPGGRARGGADRGDQQGDSADEPVVDSAAYLITGVGRRPHGAAGDLSAAPGRIEGRLFADLLLRESVVKAAALAHGVRRAAAPETRDRIRAEMRREVRRARKQRRADLREARRRLHAEQRAALTSGEDAA